MDLKERSSDIDSLVQFLHPWGGDSRRYLLPPMPRHRAKPYLPGYLGSGVVWEGVVCLKLQGQLVLPSCLSTLRSKLLKLNAYMPEEAACYTAHACTTA